MKKILSTGALFSIVLFYSTNAMAIGIGGYFNYGYSGSSWQYTDADGDSFSLKSKDRALGGGIVLDTNVAGDNVFNYRLNIGFQKYNADMGSPYNLNRVSMLHTFGFGVVRTENVRLWLGPQLGLHYIFGEGSYSYIETSYLLIGGIGMTEITEQYNMGHVDIGLAMGINFNIGEYTTLAFDCAFKYGAGYGEVKVSDDKIISAAGSILPISSSAKVNPLRHGYEMQAGVSVLFRINDNFLAKSIEM